jgi:SM-20-related protein
LTHPDSNGGVIDSLVAHGYAVLPGYFQRTFTDALLVDLEKRKEIGMFRRAGTGRNENNRVNEKIRNDQTLWLDGVGDAQTAYLDHMEGLRAALNQSLFLGLSSFEAHYAQYAPGGFYKKHIDSLKGSRNRIVSSVTYLTPDWVDADAGHLVLYDRDDNETCRILPQAGTLVLFMSEDIPHEVLPPARARSSIAGWYRCRENTI